MAENITSLAQMTLTGTQLKMGNLGEILEFCRVYYDSGLAPKSLKSKEQLFVVVLMTIERGLPLTTGICNIAVINGRPSMWGDLLMAMVEHSKLIEDWDTGFTGVPYDDNYTAWFKVKRKGRTAIKYTFSVAQAKEGKLWDKDGPWLTFPDRMLLSRARAYALRDVFPDVLLGLGDREEQQDIMEAEVISSSSAPAGAVPRANLPAPEEKTVHLKTPTRQKEPVAAATTQAAPAPAPAAQAAPPPAAQRTARQTAPAQGAPPAAEPAGEPPKRTTVPAAPAAPPPADTATQAEATEDQPDYYAMIVDAVQEHDYVSMTEAEFMEGLRKIGKTTRTGDSIRVIPENRIKGLWDNLENLLKQIEDAKTQESPM